jgi:CHAD domain-containing protein
MARVLEVVLDVPQLALQAWFAQHERNHRARAAESLDAALVKALVALPHIVQAPRTDAQGGGTESPQSGAQAASISFNRSDKLAAAGLRVVLDTSSDGRRRIVVYQRARYSPGVTACEILHEASLEANAPISAAFADAPDELTHTLGDTADAAPLTMLACERDRWQWSEAEGTAVDIAFDRTAVSTPGEAPLVRELRLTTPYMAHATEASLSALFTAAHELVAALPAFPVLCSAFDRPREAASEEESAATPARAEPVDLAGISTPHAALIAIGDNLANHWFGNDAGVRDAVSTEFVHQMRVAQRRLRTALRLFPHWADDAWKTRIAPDLKWLGRVLGDARDWDVFVDSTLPALAAADADSDNWNATRESAAAWRREARERVQTAVASARYAQLALAWLEWLSRLPSRESPAKAADRSLRAYARKRVDKYYQRLISAPKLTTLDDSSRHQQRIHAKYLRYALEFFQSIAAKKTRSEGVTTVSRVQSVLGDGNDAVVALRYLEQIDATPYQSGFARGWGEASKRYTAQEGERLLGKLRKPKITGGAAG